MMHVHVPRLPLRAWESDYARLKKERVWEIALLVCLATEFMECNYNNMLYSSVSRILVHTVNYRCEVCLYS